MTSRRLSTNGSSGSNLSGFTLIELLVVIAIIAILASILFPVFAQAREKARQAACLSNLKQVGTALRMYMDDYDNCGPDPGRTSTGEYGQLGASGFRSAVDSRSLPAVLDPYVKSRAVWTCPSAVFGLDEEPELRNTYVYSLNRKLADGTMDSEEKISELFLFNDNTLFSFWTPKFSLGQPTSRFSELRFPHHSKGYNVVFFDLHTKVYKAK